MRNSWRNHVTMYVALPVCAIALTILLGFYFFVSDSIRGRQEMSAEVFQDRVDQLMRTLDQDMDFLMESQRRLQQSVAVFELVNYQPYMDYYTRQTLELDLMSQVNTIASTSRYVSSCFLYIYPLNMLVTPDSAVVNEAIDLTQYTAFLEPDQSDCRLVSDGKGLYIIRSIWNRISARYDSLSVSVLSAEAFSHSLDTVVLAPYVAVELRFPSGTRIFSDGAQELLAAEGGRGAMEVGASSERFGWTIQGHLDLRSNSLFEQRTLKVFYLFTIALALLFLGYMLILFRNLIRPMTLLLGDAFGQIERGNLEYRIRTDKPKLFSRVYSQFNSMADQLHSLTERNLTQEMLLDRANLKQLQAQISPHFLYNSYYVLYRLIKSGRMDESEQMCSQLGKFYKYITRLDQDTQPVREELEHARAYIAIQQFRFREKVDITIEEPPEEISALRVPRLILQPILENSFKYAYDNNEGEGKVVIRVSFHVVEKGVFEIILENNGQLTDEVLAGLQDMLRSPVSPAETTALLNIHRRLQLYFSSGTGLRFDRSELGGLLVRLHIVTEGQDGTISDTDRR